MPAGPRDAGAGAPHSPRWAPRARRQRWASAGLRWSLERAGTGKDGRLVSLGAGQRLPVARGLGGLLRLLLSPFKDTCVWTPRPYSTRIPGRANLQGGDPISGCRGAGRGPQEGRGGRGPRGSPRGTGLFRPSVTPEVTQGLPNSQPCTHTRETSLRVDYLSINPT